MQIPSVLSHYSGYILFTSDGFDTDVDPAFLAVDRTPLQLDLKSAMA